VGSNLGLFKYCWWVSHWNLSYIQNTFEAVDSVLSSCDAVNEKCVENYWKYDCRRQDLYSVMWNWFDINSQARFSLYLLKNPASLQGGKFDAILSLQVMEVLRYKESLCQGMYKEKGVSLSFLILLLVIYKNGCCLHLRLLTAVENNFAGELYLNVMDCNGTVALIFWKQDLYIGMNFMFVWPCIVTNFFLVTPIRCTNFTNLFWHETLYVSDGSTVHHQEFIHCTLNNGIRHTEISQMGKDY